MYKYLHTIRVKYTTHIEYIYTIAANHMKYTTMSEERLMNDQVLYGLELTC